MFQVLIALADGEKHGYAIIKEVARRTDGEVTLSAATLYTIVRRFVQEGVIAETAERPDPALDDERRRYYRLTTSAARSRGPRRRAWRRRSAWRARRSSFPRRRPGMTSERWFRRLLRLLPFDFRADYGDEMARTSSATQRRDAAGAAWRAPRLARRPSATLLAIGPREHAAQSTQDVRYALRGMRRNPASSPSRS